jgi:hypothetical protein
MANTPSNWYGRLILMAGVPTFRTFRRTALALGLCFLTFGFAMEAKLACYSQAGVSGCDIVAAKARPADLPEVVARGVFPPGPVNSQMLVVFLAALTAASLWKADALPRRNIVYSRLSVSFAAYFSPNLFFRPPPVR